VTCNHTKETSQGLAICNRTEPHGDTGSDHIAELTVDGETVIATWSDRFPDAAELRIPAWRSDR
jgi:hypothetical protein